MRPHWHLMKPWIMMVLVQCKFFQNHALKNLLVNTGDAELIEGNSWHDNFWGSCTCEKCVSMNKFNALGKILMDVRLQIKNNV